MLTRIGLIGAAFLLLLPRLSAYDDAVPRGASGDPPTARQRNTAWRSSAGSAEADAPAQAQPRGESDDRPALRPLSMRQPLARVSRGSGKLPDDSGQEWRDYDISPYTARVAGTQKPEQIIVDWILRETGYEAWHGDPVGLLCASRNTLHVYHTPEMHTLVGEIVDRFVSTAAESRAFGLHVMTVGNPNWRARSQRALRPVSLQSQGAQAWLMAREDAALLLAELRKRGDFREHSSPHVLVSNGQNAVVNARQTRNFIRDIVYRSDAWPGFEPQSAQYDEGFTLEFSPLMALDDKTVEAVVKCHVDQIEKLVPVLLDAPTPVAPRQRTKVEVPQTSACRFLEKFRWPEDQVLLISLGVVATPVATPTGVLNLNTTLLNAPPRADLLILVESRGKLPGALAAQRPAAPK